MADDLLAALAAASNPAEKAALVAESVLADLPEAVNQVGRRCVILHWFDRKIMAALQPEDSQMAADDIYQQLAALPFMEQVPNGLTFHDLTRTGLLKRWAEREPDQLITGAAKAAVIYEAREADIPAQMEAFFCHLVAGDSEKANQILELVLIRTQLNEEWQSVINAFELQTEAEKLPFVTPFSRSWLQWAIRGLTYYKLEQYEQALADYSEAIRLNPEEATAFYNMACTYALQGQVEAMLPPLRRALELDPVHYLELISTDPDFEGVRDDPRFQALVGEFEDRGK